MYCFLIYSISLIAFNLILELRWEQNICETIQALYCSILVLSTRKEKLWIDPFNNSYYSIETKKSYLIVCIGFGFIAFLFLQSTWFESHGEIYETIHTLSCFIVVFPTRRKGKFWIGSFNSSYNSIERKKSYLIVCIGFHFITFLILNLTLKSW